MPTTLQPTYDIAVIGSGFGGSLMSMIAKRIGLSVIMIERGRHPRFAIGESTSPLTNLLIEQLANRYDLPRLLPLTSYGPWQRTYPDIVCGLKRGFTFFKHEKDQPFQVAPDRSNQLLVAASPCDELADTHWLRSDVDQFFLHKAIAAGVDYVDEVELGLPDWRTKVVQLTGRRRGEPFEVEAKFVVDATGPRGFLSKVLDIPEDLFPNYPKTQTLFSHFTGVRRCDAMPDFAYAPEDGASPYPIDDAALHHIFDGGWMWVLRFGNGVTSAGIAVTEEFGVDIGIQDGERAWYRFLRRYPSIAAQFADARPIRPFSYGSRLTYRASTMAGDNWAMLPSAAAFIDPLFSSGFPLTLLGIERLGRIFEQAWGTSEMPARLAEYASICRSEAEATAGLIAGAYGGFANFPAFAALSMFYFAAASFSEMQRRLGDRKHPAAYLQSNHPDFGPAMRSFSDRIREAASTLSPLQMRGLEAKIAMATDCINVAGLCDASKRNWYGVDLNDVVVNAPKLGFTPDEMRTIIDTADWAKGCP
jgi:FADH2 O2-dependent halogenase